MTTIRQQNIEKENARLAFEEKAVIGTQDVMIWRHYHEEQMKLYYNAILRRTQKKQNPNHPHHPMFIAKSIEKYGYGCFFSDLDFMHPLLPRI